MSAPVDVRRNLRMVLQHVLICGPDEAVQRAIQETDDAVAELIEAVAGIYGADGNGGNGRCSPDCMSCRIQRALARAQGVVL